MVEEIPQPHINVPRAMILAVVVGASSSFVLLIALLFVMTDINAVISSPAGCLAEICYQATGSVAGAICLQVRQLHSLPSPTDPDLFYLFNLLAGLPDHLDGGEARAFLPLPVPLVEPNADGFSLPTVRRSGNHGRVLAHVVCLCARRRTPLCQVLLQEQPANRSSGPHRHLYRRVVHHLLARLLGECGSGCGEKGISLRWCTDDQEKLSRRFRARTRRSKPSSPRVSSCSSSRTASRSPSSSSADATSSAPNRSRRPLGLWALCSVRSRTSSLSVRYSASAFSASHGRPLLNFWPCPCAVFTSVTVVFFLFPGETHPTGNSMSALAALPFPRKNSHLSNPDNHPNKMSPRLRRRRDWFCPPPLRRDLDLPRTETLYRPARPRRFARARARRSQPWRSEPPCFYAEGIFVANGNAGRAPTPKREGR